MKIFLWKKDAFDWAGVRAQVFRLPVDCSTTELHMRPTSPFPHTEKQNYCEDKKLVHATIEPSGRRIRRALGKGEKYCPLSEIEVKKKL